MTSVLDFREATAPDVGFIKNSWLRSFQKSKYAGPIPMEMYFDVYDQVIHFLVKRGARLWVAFNPQEEEGFDIYGFCCVEQNVRYTERRSRERIDRGRVPVVHFVYVKEMFRGEGLAKKLLAKAGVDPARFFVFTFDRGRGHVPRGHFDPLIARLSKEHIQ